MPGLAQVWNCLWWQVQYVVPCTHPSAEVMQFIARLVSSSSIYQWKCSKHQEFLKASNLSHQMGSGLQYSNIHLATNQNAAFHVVIYTSRNLHL